MSGLKEFLANLDFPGQVEHDIKTAVKEHVGMLVFLVYFRIISRVERVKFSTQKRTWLDLFLFMIMLSKNSSESAASCNFIYTSGKIQDAVCD
eukprot:g49778.t1